MPSPKPYDSARREGGSTVFLADLPALAGIGRRFDELYDTYFQPRDTPEGPAKAQEPPPLPPNPLETEEGRRQLDALKADDPAAHGRITGALRGLSSLANRAEDPEASQRSEDERLKSLGQSPEFARAMEGQRSALERLKLINPGAARSMQAQLDNMLRMAGDPAAFRAEEALKSGVGGDEPEEDEGETARIPGRFRFDCGAVAAPTANQKRLFDRLAADQAKLAKRLEKALRELHAEMIGTFDLDDPRERILFSEEVSASDVPLSYFRIAEFILPESGERFGIALESVYGHEEHGCALLVEGVKVVETGTTELLLDLEEGGDEDGE